MDLLNQGWELLPHDHGTLEIHDHDHGVEDGVGLGVNTTTNFSTLLHMDYFICPHHQPLPLPPLPEPTLLPNLQHQIPIGINNFTPPGNVKSFSTEADQHPVSQDFIKKFNETGVVDMRLDSPKSNSTWVITPQIDRAGVFHVEEKGEPHKADSTTVIKKTNKELDLVESDEFNIWKWSCNGVGAICSFGVAAAATFCLIIFSSHRNKKHPHQDHSLQFQIYTTDKRMKQVVHFTRQVS